MQFNRRITIFWDFNAINWSIIILLYAFVFGIISLWTHNKKKNPLRSHFYINLNEWQMKRKPNQIVRPLLWASVLIWFSVCIIDSIYRWLIALNFRLAVSENSCHLFGFREFLMFICLINSIIPKIWSVNSSLWQVFNNYSGFITLNSEHTRVVHFSFTSIALFYIRMFEIFQK